MQSINDTTTTSLAAKRNKKYRCSNTDSFSRKRESQRNLRYFRIIRAIILKREAAPHVRSHKTSATKSG